MDNICEGFCSCGHTVSSFSGVLLHISVEHALGPFDIQIYTVKIF